MTKKYRLFNACKDFTLIQLSNYRTVVDSSALAFDTIIFSGGKIGYQVELAISDLQKVVPLELAEVGETEICVP